MGGNHQGWRARLAYVAYRAGSGIVAVVDKVAMTPPRASWLWHGRGSLLAFLLFWSVTLLRCLSPLQWVKWLYRRWQSGRELRPDFHARDTERYFLVVLALVVLAWALLPSPGGMPGSGLLHALPWVVWVLVAETVLWLAYYLLFRNFMELGYTLYHPAEYFIVVPLVFAIQLFGLSYIGDVAPKVVFSRIFGGGDVAAHWPYTALGMLYLTIIIANLQRMSPETRFKPASNFTVVGAGDVVRHRLLPALLDAGQLRPAQITVLSTRIDEESARLLDKERIRHRVCDAEEIRRRIRAEGTPVFVATPSDAHFEYITALAASGLRFAMEKPLVVKPQELRALGENRHRLMENGFALSYYSLEKALPLTYLFTLNPYHAPFLDYDRALDEAIARTLPRLGRLASVDIQLLESPERSPTAVVRPWTEDPLLGGLKFETFIHPALLLRIVAGRAMPQERPRIRAGVSPAAQRQDSPTFLEARGERGSARYRLVAAKYVDPNKARRMARLVFEHGTVHADFDARTCTVAFSGGGSPEGFSIGIARRYAANYAVQAGLALRFFSDGWTDIRYDEFETQLETLAWLNELAVPEALQVCGEDGLLASSDGEFMGPAG